MKKSFGRVDKMFQFSCLLLLAVTPGVFNQVKGKVMEKKANGSRVESSLVMNVVQWFSMKRQPWLIYVQVMILQIV